MFRRLRTGPSVNILQPAPLAADAAGQLAPAVRSAVAAAERVVAPPRGTARSALLLLVAAGLLGAASLAPRSHLPTSFPLVDPYGQAEALWFDGSLMLPTGAGPHPAVALLTGCTPLGPSGRDLARHLRQVGYVVLAVSHFQQSPLVPICGMPGFSATAEARGAVAHLRAHPAVDPARVAVVGVGTDSAAALALAQETPSGLAPALSLAVPLPAPGDDAQAAVPVAGLDPGSLAYQPFSGRLSAETVRIQAALDARLRPNR